MRLNRNYESLVGGAIIFGVFALVVYYRISHGLLVPYDSKDEYHPLLVHAADLIRDGQSFLWSSAYFSGFPLAGDPQSLVFSPLMMAGTLLFGSSPMVFDGFVYLHLYLGSLALYLYARNIQTPQAIAILAALIFAFGGVAAARLQHTPIILAYAYYMVFFCCFNWEGGFSKLRAIVAGIMLGLSIIHINQVAFLLCLFTILWVGTIYLSNPESRRKLVLLSVISGVVAMLIAAIPFIHIFAAKAESIRSAIAFQDIIASSPAPSSLVSIISANANRNLAGTYNSPGDITETQAFVGLIPLMLGIIALTAINKYRQFFWQKLILIAALIMSLDLSLGANGYLFPLYFRLPGADNFRRPSDFLFLANLLISLFLVVSWRSTSTTLINSLQPKALIILTGVIMILCQHVWAGIVIIAITLMPSARARLTSLVAVAAITLVATNAINRLNSTGAFETYYAPDSHQQEFLEIIRRNDTDALGVPYRTEAITNLGTLFWHNTAINEGLYLTHGYNPMSSKLLDDVYGTTPIFDNEKKITSLYENYNSWLPRLLGIRYVILNRPIEEVANSQGTLVGQHNSTRLYDIGIPYDRVLNPHQRIQSDKSVLDEDFNEVFISDDSNLDQCLGTVTINRVEYSPSSIEVDYQSDNGGILAINEIYNDRIVAKVEQSNLEVHKINHMMRGVCVPAGKATMRMHYPLIPRLSDLGH